MEPTALQTLLTSAGSVVTATIGWVGDVGTKVASTPILLVFVLLSITAFGIGTFKHLLGR